MLFSRVVLVGLTILSSAAVAEVKGLYQSACQASSEPGLSVRSSINFGKVNARQVLMTYSDETCTTPAWAYDFRGPYTLSADGSLDLTVSSLRLYPLDAAVASTFSQTQFCGLENWQLNQGKEIGGLTCKNVDFPLAGFVSYDRVKEVEGGIVFGAISEQFDGSSVAKRPLTFDEQNVFKAVKVPR